MASASNELSRYFFASADGDPPGLADDVLRALAALPLDSFDAEALRIENDGGCITLRGTVPTEELRRRAESLALLVPGVSDVDNALRVGDGLDGAEPSSGARELLA